MGNVTLGEPLSFDNLGAGAAEERFEDAILNFPERRSDGKRNIGRAA